MSDSKKPTLSEIVWRNAVGIKSLRNDKGTIGGEGALAISEGVQYDTPYLLDLVKRLGESLEGAAWLSEKERWEARALLEELKQ
ncbi:hypothetical protein LCGC14_3068090 [marine sediment metagenome]|uniref:Uncharacterized protein n=1 Tax=marine sediment metagenome TaxID=412755 RepID=A0A0F8YPM1_9ZZZZ